MMNILTNTLVLRVPAAGNHAAEHVAAERRRIAHGFADRFDPPCGASFK
jgi:hypothetical protein